MTAFLRAIRTPALVLATLCLTLWTAVGMALADPGATRVSLASWAGPKYSAGAAVFSPVSLDLVRGLLGPRPGLVDPGPPARPTPVAETPTPGPTPTPSDGGTPTPDPREERAKLRSEMASDRSSVEQGENVTYTVTVTNIGDAPAHEVVILAHVPEGTRLADGRACDGPPVVKGSQTNAVCLDEDGPLGSPSTEQHLVRTLLTPLGEGESHVWRFTVRVISSTEDGTILLNHAHASASDAEETTSREVSVIVV